MKNSIFIVAFLLIIGSLLSSNVINEPDPYNCNQAIRICELGDYYFPFFYSGNQEEELYLKDTQLKKTNSIWMKFQASISGKMEFTIVPDNSEDDLDFVLYESDNSCGTMYPVRIMTSGETIGVEFSEECIGQTGLHSAAVDISESDGCYDVDDNFLSPVELSNGKSYFLLVNNFNSNSGFSILFSGDDKLQLDNNCKINLEKDINFNLYPNPAIEKLMLVSEAPVDEPIRIQIFDSAGKLFYSRNLSSLIEPMKIEISDYPAGKYYTRLIGRDQVRLKSFIKQ